jgi:hypothetical protein
MAALLEHFDHLVFVLRKNLSESISSLHQVMLHRSRQSAVDELPRVIYFCSQCQHFACFFGNSNGVAPEEVSKETSFGQLHLTSAFSLAHPELELQQWFRRYQDAEGQTWKEAQEAPSLRHSSGTQHPRIETLVEQIPTLFL